MKALIILQFMILSTYQLLGQGAQLDRSVHQLDSTGSVSLSTILYGRPWEVSWDSSLVYYQGDVVCWDYVVYESVADKNRAQPGSNTDHWLMIRPRHAYVYLRDSVSGSALLALVEAHPSEIVRVYAFAALVHHRYVGIIELLMKMLPNRSTVSYYYSDVIEEDFATAVMIYCAIPALTTQQKHELKDIISKNYPHFMDSALLKALDSR